jgi:uncharacterized protein (DUF1800 family)
MSWSKNALLSYKETLLRVRYNAGKFNNNGVEVEYPAVDELRPLSLLGASIPELFPYTGKDNLIIPPERSRPRLEVQAATLMQAVETDAPWQEEWVGFWRDHFSIYANSQEVGAYLPHWDREIIRGYCWGNFQAMLEATAQHPSMLVYLNNKSSRSGNANENYAREFFELHTLGRNAYLNNLYAQWKSVPGATAGKPQGYIDQDVYEAARAFTGWTIEDGSGLGGGQSLPKTGLFTYVGIWHDNYQKRILATEFEPYGAAMADGKKVIALCANHPATAQHISYKLVQRFVSDKPPADLVKSTTQVFLDQRNSPIQLQLVYQHIVEAGSKIPVSQKQKAKRPMRLIASFAKAVNLPFVLGDGGVSGGPLESAGVPIYGWPTPDGPPDGLMWILSAAYLRQRAQLSQGISENWWKTGEWDPFNGLPTKPTYTQLMTRWEKALFKQERPELSNALLLSQNTKPSDVVTDPRRARRLVGLLACSPSFQTEVMLPSPEQFKSNMPIPRSA